MITTFEFQSIKHSSSAIGDLSNQALALYKLAQTPIQAGFKRSTVELDKLTMEQLKGRIGDLNGLLYDLGELLNTFRDLSLSIESKAAKIDSCFDDQEAE